METIKKQENDDNGARQTEQWIEDQSLSSNDSESEEIADAWLDTAIECKKAGRIKDGIEAHMQRMQLIPYYKTTDAIRLLGLGENATIEHIPTKGVFEIKDGTNNGRFVPSKKAQTLGTKVKEIFLNRGYTLHACRSYLLPYITDGDKDANKRRIFSSQSFLQHRHEVFDARRKQAGHFSSEPPFLGELEILVWMFLFGLAINRKEAVEVLGSADVDALIQAKLLRTSPIEPDTMLVADVQVHPIDMYVFDDRDDNLLDNPDKDADTSCLFLTDWNLESLRPTHSAIMSVGYDSLELLSLTAGEILRQRKGMLNASTENDGNTQQSQKGLSSQTRILDLCCGCGIQGIFAWICYNACVAPLAEKKSCELILSDINERALHFVTANMAINGVVSSSNTESFGLCGDLFESMTSEQRPFDLIVCNPPFVAIPTTTDASLHEKTPLYGVGGGLDGMVCLRTILKRLYHFLSVQNPEAIALMVTELPNVEESPKMLSSFLPETDRKEAQVCIAYVEDDVETMEVYAREREVETGDCAAGGHGEWLSQAIASGIHNRALVLISFARSVPDEKDHDRFRLFSFPGLVLDTTKTSNDIVEQVAIDPVDEEDMFLHQAGMDFTRKNLLFSGQ